MKNNFDIQKYTALQKHYEKKYGVKGKDAVLIVLLMDRIKEDEITYKALQKKYPGLSDEDIAKKVLKIEKN